jgi:hypothetical protein
VGEAFGRICGAVENSSRNGTEMDGREREESTDFLIKFSVGIISGSIMKELRSADRPVPARNPKNEDIVPAS